MGVEVNGLCVDTRVVRSAAIFDEGRCLVGNFRDEDGTGYSAGAHGRCANNTA